MPSPHRRRLGGDNPAPDVDPNEFSLPLLQRHPSFREHFPELTAGYSDRMLVDYMALPRLRCDDHRHNRHRLLPEYQPQNEQ
jgi:hypothetical protein